MHLLLVARRRMVSGALIILTVLPVSVGPAAAQKTPIVLGLDADMSSGASQGGEAIRRGISLAVDEINAKGGVLGRPLAIEVRDHRGNPARGIDNIRELAAMKNVIAVFGGVHTPVALAELKVVHASKIPFLVPWAAGTPVVDNGFRPNFVFRVSVRDQYAGGFLVDQAIVRGHKRPGLLLERTGWGRSNEKAMQAALRSRKRQKAPVEWFNWGARDLSDSIKRLTEAGADSILLVANAREGLVAIRNVAAMSRQRRVPVISHWGITGGDFFSEAGRALEIVDLKFLQTFSFFDPPFPRKAKRVYRAYCKKFGPCQSKADLFSPVGTAHAYDLVHLLSRAIKRAGVADRVKVRSAMERLGRHNGLVRRYAPAFTANRHDALDRSDFRLSRFGRNGAILPIKPAPR